MYLLVKINKYILMKKTNNFEGFNGTLICNLKLIK